MVHIIEVMPGAVIQSKSGSGASSSWKQSLVMSIPLSERITKRKTKAIPGQWWELSMERLVAPFLNFIRRKSEEQLE
jgi:hypothetical protein